MDCNKLKRRIAAAGYSQKSLAARLEMSHSTLNRKVNGIVPFHTVEIEELCQILMIHDGAERAAIFLGKASQKWDL